MPGDLPAEARDRAAALRDMVALKCRRPLPPGRDMALVWGKSIRSPGGRRVDEERRFDFRVRKAFTARVSCARVNANSGCNPIEPIKVEFSAPISRAQALAEQMTGLPQLTTRYMSMIFRQRISRRLTEGMALGMALESLSAANLAYANRS